MMTVGLENLRVQKYVEVKVEEIILEEAILE